MIPGVFKVWGILPDVSGEKLHFHGRLLVTEDSTYIVEDHHEFLGRMFPDGPIDQQKERRWATLTRSPYLKIEESKENEPQPEMAYKSEAKPEATFDLIDQQGKKHHLEVHADDNLWIDGQHISEKDAERIFEQVRNQELKLLPK